MGKTPNKQQIQAMMKEQSKFLTKAEIYTLIHETYGIDRKKISAWYKELQLEDVQDTPPIDYTEKQVKKTLKQEGENLYVSVNIDFEVRTLEDLFAACEVDESKWEVTSWECKKWDLGIKNAAEQIETKQLFSVSAKFRPKKLDTDLVLQKNLLLDELFDAAPELDPVESVDEASPNRKFLLELALFDVHFGKLAHSEECGADYDLKIAIGRYKAAIQHFLSTLDLSSIERILLPIGNDMINVDNKQGTTTAGTPQDTDSRFYKIVRAVKNLLISTIEDLRYIAPVDVIVIAGNHDEQVSFMIGEMLDAYFSKTDDVTINNTASLRKFYKYGNVGFMFTHGDKEKHGDLGMIFAAQKPQLWADTTERYIQIGHYHKNKKINYITADEFQGFQVQVIPSLSGTDAWHAGKGYNSLKQAKAFCYDETGLFAELTYTVPKDL